MYLSNVTFTITNTLINKKAAVQDQNREKKGIQVLAFYNSRPERGGKAAKQQKTAGDRGCNQLRPWIPANRVGKGY
ncbi:hypothetical protein ACOMHN_066529 [Nucella lapillus]